LYIKYVNNYILGEVKSSERFPLANKAKKRSELFTSPNIIIYNCIYIILYNFI